MTAKVSLVSRLAVVFVFVFQLAIYGSVCLLAASSRSRACSHFDIFLCPLCA